MSAAVEIGVGTGGSSGARGAARRLKGATAWAVVESVASAGLRLASNLALARLLVPEHFGVMSLVATILQGLQLFSDIGIRPAIIAHGRGEDERFLNTAWTMQVIRGLVLWLVVWVLAAPAAGYYAMPQLAQVLPVASLTVLISGFGSTALATLNRKLILRGLVIRAIGSQALGAAVMVVWAWFSPTVWALVAGSLTDALCNMVTSHRMVAGHRCRLVWDRGCASELMRFGRWIFLSTALTFVAERSDRLVVGKVLSPADLGVYSVALLLSQQAVKFVRQYSGRVLLAAYARLHELGPEEFRRGLARVRLGLLAVALPPVWGLMVLGEWVVGVLYPATFSEAGWMLRVLSIGGAVGVLTGSIQPILLSKSDSRGHFVFTAVQAVAMVAGMLAGWSLGEKSGLVWGISLASVATYPMLAWQARRHGAWQPGIDAVAMGATAAVGCAGLLV